MRAADIARETAPLGPNAVLLTYRSTRDRAEPDASSRTIVDDVQIEELFDFIGMGRGESAPLLETAHTFRFANGFQSFSPGWELAGRERHSRVRLIKSLELYILPDGPRPGRNELAGHGLAYIRAGDAYFVLASVNPQTPPLTLRLDPDSRRCVFELHSRGAAFKAGETLAEIAVFIRKGYWEFVDYIRGLYRERACLARADFLKSRNDRLLKIGGWESWYNHYAHIDQSIISEALEGLSASPNLIREYYMRRGRPVVFQVDDGWEREVGDWEPDPARFPSGMKVLADSIEAQGHIPGLWLAPFLVCRGARVFSQKPEWLLRSRDGTPVTAGWNPVWRGIFHCLDLSRPDVREYLRGLFDTIVNGWGYRYLKLDFLYAGMLNGEHAIRGPAYRWYRETLEPIVSAVKNRSGDPVVFLGCSAPLESSVGLFPLMRIGADTRETWDQVPARLIGYEGRPSAYINLKSTLGRAFMNRSLYYSDPDVVFMRSVNCSLGSGEKELIAAVNFMFGSQIMISDDPGSFGSPGEKSLTERVLRLFDALEGREYGVVMLRRDLWRCFSRDESIRGIVNLRGKAVSIPEADVQKWRLFGEPLTQGAASDRGRVRVNSHSIALWR